MAAAYEFDFGTLVTPIYITCEAFFLNSFTLALLAVYKSRSSNYNLCFVVLFCGKNLADKNLNFMGAHSVKRMNDFVIAACGLQTRSVKPGISKIFFSMLGTSNTLPPFFIYGKISNSDQILDKFDNFSNDFKVEVSAEMCSSLSSINKEVKFQLDLIISEARPRLLR